MQASLSLFSPSPKERLRSYRGTNQMAASSTGNEIAGHAITTRRKVSSHNPPR